LDKEKKLVGGAADIRGFGANGLSFLKKLKAHSLTIGEGKPRKKYSKGNIKGGSSGS